MLLTSLITELLNDPQNTTIGGFNKIANSINNYLSDNLSVVGVYSGTISGPLPDPLNGSYTFSFLNSLMTGSSLSSGVNNFSVFSSNLNLGFKTILMNPTEGVSSLITCTDDISFDSFSMDLSMSDIIAYINGADINAEKSEFSSIYPGKSNKFYSDLLSMYMGYKVICNKITSSINSTILPPLPAESTDSGTGTVTFNPITFS